MFILYTLFTLNSIIVSNINTNGIPIWEMLTVLCFVINIYLINKDN